MIKPRFWEIDTIRGIAIVLMIFFHVVFDLAFLQISAQKIYLYISNYLPYIIGMMFIFIAGISLTLSYEKTNEKLRRKEILRKFMYRGIKLLLLGLMITIISWLYVPQGVILFGVLHCIGLSIIISYPFLIYEQYTLPVGLLLIVGGFSLSQITVSFPWLLWIGLKPTAFYTLDYYPLLPWLGILLLGVFFGRILYPQGSRLITLPDLSELFPISILEYLGQHSLLIYLVHQPILISLLSIYIYFD